MARRGRRKQPYYHIIVADSRAPRDGKFIERIGSYNPMTKPATIELDRERAYEWLMKGAQPTETARSILRFKGVLYKKHLQRGVTKGALTQEEADKLFDSYVAAKEEKIAARVQQTKEERLAFLKQVSGSPKKQYVEEAPATEALSEFQESGDAPAEEVAAEATAEETAAEVATPVVEEASAEAEAPAEEAAPAEPEAETKEEAAVSTEEAPVEAVAEEAAAPEETAEEAPAADAETEEAPAEATSEEEE